jgi:hypothetical protein
MLNTNEATSVKVEVLEELTEEEERERQRLEIKVDKALSEGWSALKQLRDYRLYRSTHKTFEEYAKDRFGYNRAHAYRLIQAAQVIENLSPNGRQIHEMSPIGRHVLPNSERLCRELAKLPSKVQPIAWEKVLEVSDEKAPTARVVKSIVEQLKEKPLGNAKDYCQVGDVFTLVRLEGKERIYNGCWAIAVEPRDFTVLVDVHDVTITVKPENLNKIDSPEAHRQLPQILRRIRRVREVPGFRDRAAYMVLEHLGKQTYLTPLEDKLLQVIEREYGVEREAGS